MSDQRGAASVTLDTIMLPVVSAAVELNLGPQDQLALRYITEAVTDALLAKGTIEAPDADSVTQWHPFLRIPLDGAE